MALCNLNITFEAVLPVVLPEVPVQVEVELVDEPDGDNIGVAELEFAAKFSG